MKKTSLAKLSIKNVEFYAYHGVKAEEKKLGGKYEVDLDLYYNSKNAIIRDDINDALNYEEAIFGISEVLNYDSYNLIETMANEILNITMDKFEFLEKATVRIRKINVPMRRVLDYIEIEQSIERQLE